MFKRKLIATGVLCGFSLVVSASGMHLNSDVVSCSESDIRQDIEEREKVRTTEKNIHITNENYKHTVSLPDNFEDRFIRVISSSDKQFVIASGNTVAGNSMFVDKGDEYLFKYHGRYRKWQLIESPTVHVKIDNGVIPAPTKPNTEVLLDNKNWIPKIALPSQAKQGDLVKITSNSDKTAKISHENTTLKDPVDLIKHQKYVFIFNDTDRKWYLHEHPNVELTIDDIKNGTISVNSYNSTVTINEGEISSDLHLPYYKYSGQRIVIKNNSQNAFFVYLNKDERELVQSNDIVSFESNDKWQWTRETKSVNMLLLYSHKHLDRLGTHEKAKEELINELSYVNEALENSKAEYRYRLAYIDVLQTPDDWHSLGDALSSVRSIPSVKDLIENHSIDMVYYEATSTSDGYCGLAFMPGNTSVGLLGCKSMGHELGHNWNITHFAEETSGYNAGYREEATLVGGNSIPFYSTPDVISPYTRMPLGIPDEVDATRAMNERVSQMSDMTRLENVFQAEKSYKGDDLRNFPASSEAQCLVECIDDTQCSGYSYNLTNSNHNKDWCWLHSKYDLNKVVEQHGTNTAYILNRANFLTVDYDQYQKFTATPDQRILSGSGYDNYVGYHTETGDYGPQGYRAATFSHSQATAWCENLNTLEYEERNDWRLPRLEEMKRLYFKFGNIFTSKGWPSNYTYWTNTFQWNHYNTIFMLNGNNFIQGEDYGLYASCVSGHSEGGAPMVTSVGDKKFTATPGVDYLIDLGFTNYAGNSKENGKHGLNGYNAATFKQDQVSGWCELLSDNRYDGRSNWRQATREELNSLYNSKGNMFDSEEWPTANIYWSSTPYSLNENWGVVLRNGGNYANHKSYSFYASCVSEDF